MPKDKNHKFMKLLDPSSVVREGEFKMPKPVSKMPSGAPGKNQPWGDVSAHRAKELNAVFSRRKLGGVSVKGSDDL